MCGLVCQLPFLTKCLASFNICNSDRLKLCVRRNRESILFIAISLVYSSDAQKICSEWNFFPYFQTMVQLLGALTGCVQHVCATQESVILENIHSLPSSILHVIKSTFVHCKVSNGSKYTLNGLESMSKGPELVVFMFVHKLTFILYYCIGFFHRANSMYVDVSK